METPHITHLTADDLKYVYEPAEDSFLLIDALELDLPQFKRNPPTICVELGSGSGIVITALAKAIHSSTIFFGIDINPRACNATLKTACKNQTLVECINMDLLTSFKERTVDVLIFNPPYVVTTDDEINKIDTNITNKLIGKSWAGGHNGRQIMNKVFEKLNDILSCNGVAYILVIKDNKPEEILVDLKQLNFSAKIIIERKIRGEHLFVLKIQRT